MNLRNTFAFAILLCLAALTQPAKSTTLPSFPFVTVSGTSTEEVKPDIAEIIFQLTTFDKSSDKASEVLSDATQSVLTILSKNAIQSSDIEAYEVNKSIRRGKDKNYNQTGIIGYEFTRSFSVKMSGLDNYPNIIRALYKIDNLSNIRSKFDTSERDDIQLALISKATEKAKKKASLMAQGLGVRLDGVFAFNDTGSFTSFFATFGLSDNARYSVSEMVRSDVNHLNKSDMPIFIPAHIEISKTINVIYKITR